MLSLLGVLYLTLSLIFLVKGKVQFALPLGLVAPVGVVASIGDQGVPVFYFLALVVVATGLVHRNVRRSDQRWPGSLALVLFVAWSLAVTIIAPAVFAGIPVLIPVGGIDTQLADPGELAYTKSHVAQAAYLILGVGAVFALSKVPLLPPGYLTFGLASITVICTLRLLSNSFALPWPEGFFDNSTNVTYIETFAGGQSRFRGVFAEPSELAASSLVVMVYFVTKLPTWTPKRRALALLITCAAAINMWASTSATAIGAGCAFLAVFVAIATHRFVTGNAKVGLGTALGVCLVFVLAVWKAPTWISALTSAIEGKIATESYSVRTGADAFSMDVLANTWGIGAGLGSNRPSTFFPMLLSNVGVVGAFLFLTAAVLLVRRTWSNPQMRPVIWAFVALMVSKSVAGPNMSEPLIWLLLGVLANAAWWHKESYPHSRGGEGTPQSTDVPTRPARVTPAHPV